MTTYQPQTLTEAKETVRDLLKIAGFDGETVYRSLKSTERKARRLDGFTEAHADGYAMLRLALCDLTGNAEYRR